MISKQCLLSMAVFAFGLGLSGCSDEIKPPRTTGVLEIRFTTEPNICTEPCADGRYVVAHSELRFSASAVGENANAPLRARSFDGISSSTRSLRGSRPRTATSTVSLGGASSTIDVEVVAP